MKHRVKTVSGEGLCWRCFGVVADPAGECPGFDPSVLGPEDYDGMCDRAIDAGCLDVEGMQGADDEWPW